MTKVKKSKTRSDRPKTAVAKKKTTSKPRTSTGNKTIKGKTATAKAPIKLTRRKPAAKSSQRSGIAAAINRSPKKTQPGQKSEVMLSCPDCGKRVVCEATREDLRMCELRCPKCGKKIIPGP